LPDIGNEISKQKLKIKNFEITKEANKGKRIVQGFAIKKANVFP